MVTAELPGDPGGVSAIWLPGVAERTGRTAEEWIAIVEASGPDPLDQKRVRDWLRDEHGVRQNTRWAIADVLARKHGWERPTVTGYTDGLYAGAKASLRPLHDAVVDLALGLGEDVEPQGRSTYIPLVRATQFAAVAPGPRGTLRVGLRYRDDGPEDPRVEPARNFAQASHWVHLPGDTDPAEATRLEPLLRRAYDQNG